MAIPPNHFCFEPVRVLPKTKQESAAAFVVRDRELVTKDRNKEMFDGGAGGGKEGDWECSGCHNRNYAFRSFCNRCKQARLLVDAKTPSDSKWLPRIGDWICSGCTNNNYASREKCKKCLQPKELAAMPAVAIPGASVSTHPTYFARARGGIEQMLNVGSLQPSLPLNTGWAVGGTGQYGNQSSDPFGLHSASNLALGSSSISAVSYANQLPPVANANGWRTGDWMCTCGFHNYSSRVQCKKCNAPAPISAPLSLVSTAVTALGIKRLASEEFIHNLDTKRLNAGHVRNSFQHEQPSSGFESFQSLGSSQMNSIYAAVPSGNTSLPTNWQVGLQASCVPAAPTLLGKGAKQWRDGDWMCSNCNNHNYASREQCNRCKTQREVPAEPLSVA